MGMQICAGLILLHQENQYHGDLKPKNLCFRESSKTEIVIVDFSRASFLGSNLFDDPELAQLQDPKLVAALIFIEDLSTTELLSEYSGRGIGMTAVAQYIAKAGGTVSIELGEPNAAQQGFRQFALVICLPMDLFQCDVTRLEAA